MREIEIRALAAYLSRPYPIGISAHRLILRIGISLQPASTLALALRVTVSSLMLIIHVNVLLLIIICNYTFLLILLFLYLIHDWVVG